ncbi:hypothetical protein Godav_010293, partial [Gossypium davidsonii]|nr:hypothetical protein [Gossypium davidsonii]MBA0660579.1 hypothetical protein [Gossypium klotzschianum]
MNSHRLLEKVEECDLLWEYNALQAYDHYAST